MNWVTKLDNTWKGLLIGLLFPLFIFFCYWLFFHHQIGFPRRFLRYLMNGYLLSNVLKMCGLGNLLLFYFGLHYKIDKFSRGIVFSVLFYVALIAYVNYFLETQYI